MVSKWSIDDDSKRRREEDGKNEEYVKQMLSEMLQKKAPSKDPPKVLFMNALYDKTCSKEVDEFREGIEKINFWLSSEDIDSEYSEGSDDDFVEVQHPSNEFEISPRRSTRPASQIAAERISEMYSSKR